MMFFVLCLLIALVIAISAAFEFRHQKNCALQNLEWLQQDYQLFQDSVRKEHELRRIEIQASQKVSNANVIFVSMIAEVVTDQ